MAGMMQYGLSSGNDAMRGMRYYSSMKRKMDAEKEAMDKMDAAQEKQMNMSYAGAGGAAAGAMTGGAVTSWSGPGMAVGMAVGALVGSIAGSFF